MHIHPSTALACTWLAALLFAGTIVPASAADAPKDVSGDISALRTSVVSAEVWIAPRALESRGDITETNLRQVGCSYLASEKQDLVPLLDLLANAGFIEHDQPEQDDTLMAVYLTTRAGTVIPLLLSAEFAHAPSAGKYNRMTPVVARMGFEGDLRAWAARRASTKPRASCQK